MSYSGSYKRQMVRGLMIFLVTFVGFGGWSVLAPLQEAALAPGLVILEGNRKTIKHLEGGSVQEIRIVEGQQVHSGDLLISLDDTQLRAQLDIGLGQFYAVKALEMRLRAERDGLQEVVYPEALTITRDQRARDAMDGQNQVMAARASAHRGEKDVLEKRIDQLKVQSGGLAGQRRTNEKLLASFIEEIADVSALLEEGYADKTRLRDLERNEDRLEGQISELTVSIAQVEIAEGETELQILQLEKHFHTQVVGELGVAQTEAYDLEKRVRALTYRVDQAQIKSPVEGRVLGLSVHTVGGVVGAGEPLLYIIPEDENLIVEARVNPTDIDRIQRGQSADIRFTAFSSQTTPVINGQVTSVAADVLVDQNTGIPYFLAQVTVTTKGLEDLGKLVLVPGMPAEVLIQTGSRTLFQYLAQPINNTFARSMLER